MQVAFEEYDIRSESFEFRLIMGSWLVRRRAGLTVLGFRACP